RSTASPGSSSRCRCSLPCARRGSSSPSVSRSRRGLPASPSSSRSAWSPRARKRPCRRRRRLARPERRAAYHLGVSSFPVTRLRRFRRTASLRGLVREHRLSLDQFVMPLFVAPEPLANEALPGMARFDIEGLLHEVEALTAGGVGAVILFGVPEVKDEEATGAWEEDGIVQIALRALRP